jgi:hypothetical protein
MVTVLNQGMAPNMASATCLTSLRETLKKGIEIGAMAAERRYDDGGSHYFVEREGINSAIRIKDCPT